MWRPILKQIGSDHGAHKITQIKKIKKKREQWEQGGGVVPNSSWEPQSNTYDKIEFSSKRDINQFNPWKYARNES